MKPGEAHDLVTMMKGATGAYLDDEKVEFWELSLLPLDAGLATKAVLHGVNSWKTFPSWAEFKEIYAMQGRRQREDEREAEVVKEGRYGYAPPEWTLVWNWARNYRDPKEERGLPQQGDWADPMKTMTTADYDALHAEWVAAGSPKENPLLAVAVGGERWV